MKNRAWFNCKSIVLVLFAALATGWCLFVARERALAWRLYRFDANVRFVHGQVRSISFRDSSNTFGVRGTPSPFGDGDMPQLLAFRHLDDLSLVDTSVTDAGLNQVLDLPSLTSLSVRVDQITLERERQFRDTLPHLAIEKIHFIDGVRVVDGYQ